MRYFCCNDQRRTVVLNQSPLNGIDFVEVSDDPFDPISERQRTLFVHLLKPVSANAIKLKNVVIEGGERIRNITVQSVLHGPANSPPLPSNVLVLQVSERGDFSTYTLRLVANPESEEPPSTKFDQVLSAIDFSFKVSCPTDFDCLTERSCPTEQRAEPEISYLAKDYASFRQLMLDRLSLLMPGWTERSPVDLGIALVELLAYVGDYLSYQQDAVATESYLNTARRRASVKRHVRLVDYPMHDGRNARAWIHLKVTEAGDGLVLSHSNKKKTSKFLTGIASLAKEQVISEKSDAFVKALVERPQIFEICGKETKKKLFRSHNEMKFYTWGAQECCLPKGSTSASLDGDFAELAQGDVLVFLEKLGPQTGQPEDADQAHRHAVRLTKIELTEDRLGGKFRKPHNNDPLPVTSIEWAPEDALPFALCVSAKVEGRVFDDVGVALGNIILVDHGRTFTDVSENPAADLARIPTSLEPAVVPSSLPELTRVLHSTTSRCEDPTTIAIVPRFRPRLKYSPITQAVPYDPENPPRSATLTCRFSFEDPGSFPMPAITLTRPGEVWEPLRDLLGTDAGDENFVVEVETDGTAYLRFGDGHTGRRPPEGTRFLATYRIGNGTAGNVGADSIKHLVTSDPSFLADDVIEAISNPLPSTGGVDAETIEHVRQNAPSAFRRQERAVTPDDYEALVTRQDVVERCGLDIQHSAAAIRWTGSWNTMFVTVDRLGGRVVDDDFESDLRRCLERYRMAGQDLEVDGPRFVSLEIELAVCIKPGYFFEDVQQALLRVFSSRAETDGSRGVFHPDNFTFGQPVLSSRLIAAAQSVTGVASVVLTKFQRQGTDSTEALESGRLEIGRQEIARLDNNPNFPERGVFRLKRA